LRIRALSGLRDEEHSKHCANDPKPTTFHDLSS
jgi:hypothetical protein